MPPAPPLTDWPALHRDRFRGATACVTGGAGFIGSHLVEALTMLGARVIVIDDLSGGDAANIAPFNVEFVNASILDENALRKAMRGARYVFHLAALGSVPRSVEQPRAYHDVNSTGTLNVLDSARELGVQRVIFSASSSAYGTNPVPWVETMPPLPQSPYAATKLAGEALLRAYSGSMGLDTVSLRYFNIFGPRQNANSAYAAVIAAFARAFGGGAPPVIYGDGSQSRDFTFVHNAVHANLLAASSESPLAGEVINVGCGKSVTVTVVATIMAAAYGRHDLSPVHQPPRPGDLLHSYAHLKRAESLLGYKPIVDFETGLAQTIAWYRGQG